MKRYYCFNITSECNMSCEFCYRVGNTIGFVDIDKAFQYIDYIVATGGRSINITGGEPLLHPKWREIIRYCHEKGIKVKMSTNGLLLDVNDDILQFLYRLCIPLDNATSVTDKSMMRTPEQVSSAIKIINQYIEGNYNYVLTVNTVITKQNIDELDNIYNIVNHAGIDWKLFELREKGHFYNYSKYHVLPSNEVEKVISHFTDKKDKKCNIYYRIGGIVSGSKGEHEEEPYILNYNGDLYLANQNSDQLIGNINDLKL